MNRMRVALVVVAAVVAAGCSDQILTACTPDRRLGLGIVVVNDRTEAHICGAAVVARSGSYTETLRQMSDARVSGCLYVGADERSGNYSIQAEASGFSPRTLGDLTVPLTRDGCHVDQVIATIRLVPIG